MHFWSYFSFAPSHIFPLTAPAQLLKERLFPNWKNIPPNEPLGRQADTESMAQAYRKRPPAFASASSHWVKNSCS